mmetsp:Transcript_16036/g.15395  ORF Transcript_16036/g.15395 Transcript_16036/m.15395 type:complete len:132 (+) Transcript_16036:106-501(+)
MVWLCGFNRKLWNRNLWLGSENKVVFDPKDSVSIERYEADIGKGLEQRNLLRFKVEVLVNMLAIEEKKMESLTKRIDVLKWSMHSKGVHEENFNNMIEEISIKNENNDMINTNISSLMSTFDLSKHHHHQA